MAGTTELEKEGFVVTAWGSEDQITFVHATIKTEPRAINNHYRVYSKTGDGIKFKDDTGILEQHNRDSPFKLYANPETTARILSGLCWCCGNPRIEILLDAKWREICIECDLDGFVSKPCKYKKKSGCMAKGAKDGNCKGELPESN